MLTKISQLLDQQQLEAARNIIATGQFTDGSASAGMAAKQVKHNEELALEQAHLKDLNNLVMGSLVKHPT